MIDGAQELDPVRDPQLDSAGMQGVHQPRDGLGADDPESERLCVVLGDGGEPVQEIAQALVSVHPPHHQPAARLRSADDRGKCFDVDSILEYRSDDSRG